MRKPIIKTWIPQAERSLFSKDHGISYFSNTFFSNRRAVYNYLEIGSTLRHDHKTAIC